MGDFETWPYAVLFEGSATQANEASCLLSSALNEVMNRETVPQLRIYTSNPNIPFMNLVWQAEPPVRIHIEEEGDDIFVKRGTIFHWHPELPQKNRILLIEDLVSEANAQKLLYSIRLPIIPRLEIL